jgi:hypothetical protein
MANVKINQKILILKKDGEINKDLKFPAGTEFEIVADVVYMGGFPIPSPMQNLFYNWLTSNMGDKNMFKEESS